MLSQDLLVDDALDLEQLLASDGAEVHEVEPQPIGRNQRARLLDVLAQHLSKRRMEQVSGRVVAAGRVAQRSARLRHVTRSLRDSSPLVTWTPCRRGQFAGAHDRGDARLTARSRDGADVGDLAASLEIERRLGQSDEAVLTRDERRHFLPFAVEERQDLRVDLRRLVAAEGLVAS